VNADSILFHLYAAQKDKSMTQVVEEFIDSFKLEASASLGVENGKNSDTSSLG